MRSVSAANKERGRLYSLDSRNQTEGAAAERLNNAARCAGWMISSAVCRTIPLGSLRGNPVAWLTPDISNPQSMDGDTAPQDGGGQPNRLNYQRSLNTAKSLNINGSLRYRDQQRAAAGEHTD